MRSASARRTTIAPTFTGQAKFADGTFSLPSGTFASDPDTGFYRPGGNTFGIAGGGIAAVNFDGTQGYPPNGASYNWGAAAFPFGTMFLTQLRIDATITAGGTTGNQTINKALGSVNIAAGNSTVTVTNSLVTANSVVIPTILTNDTTALIKNVVCSAGSFIIRFTANATAETKVGFVVLNPLS
jgi:hypothetical protein